MEARDLSDLLKEYIERRAYQASPAELVGAETRWGSEDSDFFVDVDGERFLVIVAKIEGE